MIVMVTRPNSGTHVSGQATRTVYLDGVTYWTGTPADIARRRDALGQYEARQRAAQTGPSGTGVDPGESTVIEVQAVPEQWAAIVAAGQDAVTAYARLRALGVTPAIPVGVPA